MAGAPLKKTKFPGVYTRQLDRKHNGKPDLSYVVWLQYANGKAGWKTVGAHSKGMRPARASVLREELQGQQHADNTPAAPHSFTVGHAIDAYAIWAKGEGKDISRDLHGYSKHLQAKLHALPVEAVTPAILTQLKAGMLATVSEQTALHRFSFLRRAINYAIAVDLFPGPNPVRSSRHGAFRMPAPQNARERYLTPAEAKALLAELRKRSKQLHDMALLSLRTGLRATEIFDLRRQDIDPAAGVVYVDAKGGNREVAHADADVIEMLLSYPRQPYELVFQDRYGKRIQKISAVFMRTVNGLGLQHGITDPRQRITFHVLRHTFASWLAQSGTVTLHALKEIMRHKSLRMTERYAHLIPGHQKKSLSIVADFLSD